MIPPPPSETGATAEEEARITLAEAMLCVKAGNMVGAEARIEQHLVHFAERAKRSAHLEDARAILALGMRACPDKGHDRWCHYCVTRGDALDEAQQVVEDALSRTGAK